MKERRIHLDVSFIAHHQPAVMTQPSQGPFDFPSLPIPSQGATILPGGTPPILPMRTDQLGAEPLQFPPRRIAVVRLVGDHPPQPTLGTTASAPRHPHCRQGARQQFHFRRGGRVQVLSQRNTLAVDHHHPLRALAPLGFADARAPFLAGAKLPSTKLSLQSSRPRASSSAKNCRQILSQIPRASHRCNRRQHVLGLGYTGGKSRHRAPVLSTHRMPSKTRRLSAHGRPRLWGLGKNGSILFHCGSDKNGLSIPSFSQILPKGASEKYLHHFSL